jgi:hypothetical protein
LPKKISPLKSVSDDKTPNRKGDNMLQRRSFVLAVLALIVLPLSLGAQALFTFNVDNLEGYNRTGNWVYDADGPGFPTGDGNWFTFGTNAMFHYYAENNIHSGFATTITCTGENTDLASAPAELAMTFTEFDLVSFRRINTLDPALPWDLPGLSGDVRVYSNASGYISHNGTPVLTMNNASFVITTPYPNQAQVRALSPLLSPWVGDIGTGAFQTGYGFGWIDVANSDPSWAALFAAANYKVELDMIGITSVVYPNYGWFDFTMDIRPGTLSQTTANELVNVGSLPATVDFPSQDASMDILGGTPGGMNGDMTHFYLNLIRQNPGTPAPLYPLVDHYWELGSTFDQFSLNLTFEYNGKAPGDWRVLYRSGPWAPWTIWPDFNQAGNTITAIDVSDVGEFTLASLVDETLPVVLTNFMGSFNSNGQAVINWSTASETAMSCYNLYLGSTDVLSTASCITVPSIPAENQSDGANYSFTSEALSVPGSYYVWLESVSLDGSTEFYGPLALNLNPGTDVPGLPVRDLLGDARPNPFATSTAIAVEVKAGDSGLLEIFNIRGQRVYSRAISQGAHVINWDGRDSSGIIVANGVYFYRLSATGYQAQKRLMLIK